MFDCRQVNYAVIFNKKEFYLCAFFLNQAVCNLANLLIVHTVYIKFVLMGRGQIHLLCYMYMYMHIL